MVSSCKQINILTVSRNVGRVLVLAAILSVCSIDAYAAKKKKHKVPQIRGVQVTVDDTFTAPVKVKVRRKQKSQNVVCYKGAPGELKTVRQKLLFVSYSATVSRLMRTDRHNKNISLYKQLQKAGKPACQKPDFLSLERYTGPYGEEQAQILYQRFAFGANPETIGWSQSIGLDATIQSLTNYTPENALEDIVADLNCDGRLAGEDGNETCDPSDPNDLYMPGVRYGVEYRFAYSQNPYFEKMFMWLHDERLSASSEALDGCEAHAFLPHVNLIRRAALSGDYIQYMRDWNVDQLGHFDWLDGRNNRGTSPNENYAREFWELGTVGPTDLDGKPVYSDQDIAQSALAFSGWDVQGYEMNEHYICLPGYVPGLHSGSAKTIFAGTPYQSTVYNADDVLSATFQHPRTSESLAQDLWKEFINPYATPTAIKELAALIRANNFNLTPVMRRIMASKAVYADRSKKSLIKHPVDLLYGFIRQTGMPMNTRTMDSFLSKMGQQPLLPPTVFGWNERKLAGESYVLEWRNTALWMLERDSDDLKEDGYDFYQTMLATFPHARSDSLEAIDSFSRRLGVHLSDAQIAQLDQYMNYDLQHCSNTSQCGGQDYKLERSAFDAHADADFDYKSRGLLAILTMLPEYRLK